MMTTQLLLLVLSLTFAALSFAKPKWSLIEVEEKEGGGNEQEDKRLDEDRAVGGRQDGSDYRMVIII